MSLKKMQKEKQENMRLQLQQSSSSTASMQETQSEIIRRQADRIEAQEKLIKQLRQEYRKKLNEKDNEIKRAWKEVDELRRKPPKVEYRDRISDRCSECRIQDYQKSNRSLWRYVRFLTVLFISETLCIALQSPAFLTDLWNLAKISLLVASSFLYHAALSGYYIANALGWLNRGDYLYYAGWLLQAAFPLCILIALFVLVKVVLPKHRSRSREAKRDRHIPRMLGIHVVCAAMVIALCTAGRIPKYHGIRINSVFIPIIAYLIWLLISRYYEGGWWFKGWDENTRNWW